MEKIFEKLKKFLEGVFFIRHTLGFIGTIISVLHWALNIPLIHHILTSAVGLTMLVLAILSIIYIEQKEYNDTKEKESNDGNSDIQKASSNDRSNKRSMG
jgi:hypothetical protein